MSQVSLTGRSRSVEEWLLNVLLSGSSDKTIRVWDINTSLVIFDPLRGHGDGVTALCLSPDSRLIASGSHDATVRIWSVISGKPIGEPLCNHKGTVSSVAFSPDGTRIVSGSVDHSISIWVEASDKEGFTHARRVSARDDWIGSVLFLPGGGHIVSASLDRGHLFHNVATGEAEENPFLGHTGIVYSAQFSPDGGRVVSGSSDGTIRLWDSETGCPLLHPKRHRGLVHHIQFLPKMRDTDKERILSAGSDSTIHVWDASNGELLGEPLTGHKGPISAAAVRPSTYQVATGSIDGTIRVWNCPPTGPARTESIFEGTGAVWSLDFSKDGERLASGSTDGCVRIWSVKDKKLLSEFRCEAGTVLPVRFSPDGVHVIAGSRDGVVRVWDVEKMVECEPLRGHADSVFSLAFSLQGVVAAGSTDRTIFLWDFLTRKTKHILKGHQGPVSSVAFSPKGSRLVSASFDCTIRLWKTETGESIGFPCDAESSV